MLVQKLPSRVSEYCQLAPSHITGHSQTASSTSYTCSTTIIFAYLFCCNGFCLPLGLISYCDTLFITKDRIWTLICLLPHLLSVQGLKFRLVSWVLTMVKSDGCLLSSILLSLPVLYYVLPLVYLSFCPWYQWLTCTMIYGRWSFEYCVHLEGIYPSVFFIQLPYPSLALFHVVPLARKSNGRSHSLLVIIYALTNLLNKTEDKEREKWEWKYFNDKLQTSQFFSVYVVMNSNIWWRLNHTKKSLAVLPFSILDRKQVSRNMSSGSFPIFFFIISHRFYDTVT